MTMQIATRFHDLGGEGFGDEDVDHELALGFVTRRTLARTMRAARDRKDIVAPK